MDIKYEYFYPEMINDENKQSVHFANNFIDQFEHNDADSDFAFDELSPKVSKDSPSGRDKDKDLLIERNRHYCSPALIEDFKYLLRK